MKSIESLQYSASRNIRFLNECSPKDYRNLVVHSDHLRRVCVKLNRRDIKDQISNAIFKCLDRHVRERMS